MKYLITGHAGFVGPYLIDFILHQEPQAEIVGVDIIQKEFPNTKQIKTYCIDLLDSEKLLDIVKHERPRFIIHLASYSSVGFSWQQPNDSFRNNTNIFLNLLEAIRVSDLHCRLLSVGSSEEYGIINEADVPITEDHPLLPISPYAVARVAQEHLSLVYAKGFNVDIVCTRSFNHIGVGQSDTFVVSSIGKQVASVIKGSKSKITVGDVTVIRDFVNVKDVVRAYYLLLKKGRTGEVYNVCGGIGYRISDLVKIYREIAGLNIEVDLDKSLLRPVENPIVIGSNNKIKNELGWSPTFSIKESLTSMLHFWRKSV